MTGPGLYLGSRCVPLKTKRGHIDPFGTSSVKRKIWKMGY